MTMKRLTILICACLLSAAQARSSMTAEQIALELLSCRPFKSIAPGNEAAARELICTLLKVANNDVETIRAGLQIYQDVIASPGIEKTKVEVNGCFTVPVLFELMFEHPSGPLREFSTGSTTYVPKRPIAKEEVVEYCLPISVDENGVIELGWYFGSHAGHLSQNLIAMLEYNLEHYPLRKINFAVQPCGAK